MEENRNNRAVERRMKEALKNDRARIQVGRISHFGLLEMSRQRLRPGLIEGTFKPCPHCEGRGIVRSVSSCGLGVLRQIEDYLQKGRSDSLTVKLAREVAFYLLNEKRDSLLELEQQYGISIFLVPGDEMKGTQAVIERAPDRARIQRRVTATATPVQMESAFTSETEMESDETEEVSDEESADDAGADADGSEETRADGQDGQQRREGGRRRRRRGRRGQRWEDRGPRTETEQTSDGSEVVVAADETEVDADIRQSDEGPVPAETVAAETAQDGEASGDASQTEGGERNNNDRRGRRKGRFGRNRERHGEGNGNGNGEGHRPGARRSPQSRPAPPRKTCTGRSSSSQFTAIFRVEYS